MLCIKLEINQGYTTRYGQPIIKINWQVFLIEMVSVLWAVRNETSRII